MGVNSHSQPPSAPVFWLYHLCVNGRVRLTNFIPVPDPGETKADGLCFRIWSIIRFLSKRDEMRALLSNNPGISKLGSAKG